MPQRKRVTCKACDHNFLTDGTGCCPACGGRTVVMRGHIYGLSLSKEQRGPACPTCGERTCWVVAYPDGRHHYVHAWRNIGFAIKITRSHLAQAEN